VVIRRIAAGRVVVAAAVVVVRADAAVVVTGSVEAAAEEGQDQVGDHVRHVWLEHVPKQGRACGFMQALGRRTLVGKNVSLLAHAVLHHLHLQSSSFLHVHAIPVSVPRARIWRE